jgi:hypothetical protein
MLCWRSTEKISLTIRVKNEEVLHRIKEEWNVLHTIKRRQANWIGYILLRYCLLKHVTEGKMDRRIKVTERQGRRHKQLVDDPKKMIEYWKFKKETLHHTPQRTCCPRDYRPVTRCETWHPYVTAMMQGSTLLV